jgi:hypothetical protein
MVLEDSDIFGLSVVKKGDIRLPNMVAYWEPKNLGEFPGVGEN